MPILIAEDAPDQSVKITSVTMDNCDESDDYCVAYKGVETRGQIQFTTTKAVETLTCSLKARLSRHSFWAPFPNGCPKDGCTSLSKGKCPLSVGTSGTYDIKITPPGFAPLVSFHIANNIKVMTANANTIPPFR